MDAYKDILSWQLLGNSLESLLVAVGVFVGITVLLSLFKRVLLKRVTAYAKRTSFKLDDVIVQVINRVGASFYMVIALYVAVQHLTFPSVIDLVVEAAFLIVIVNEVIKILERIMNFLLRKQFVGEKEGERRISSMLSIIIKVILWSVGILLVLSNLGINVNSLIAGFGIGGIAISLALQNILGDLFSSFSIAFDKPFEEGDFIVVGEDKGTVKKIGLKTTRLESLQGEEIVISNNELTSARVQNFKRMKKRRIVFTLGVTYETPSEKLDKIPEIIEKVIKDQPQAEFDRAHFFEFGDSNLNFEVVYYVLTDDYNQYMDAQQGMNLAILREFEKEGIEMAYPTRTVYMKKD